MAVRYGSNSAVSTGLFHTNIPDSEALVTVWMLVFLLVQSGLSFLWGFKFILHFFQEENLKLIIALTL